ncbi:MAG TPA: hypothetical protein VJV23_13095, partial [Candidatus Polarisedimenticolia bacterium]|nr:hypothetical protein [Candidatus Polarisedimenticolia bacterium]
GGAAAGPEGISETDLARWMSGVEARAAAARAYRPRPYGGDAVLVRGADSAAARSNDAPLGWRRLVQGRLSVEWAEGSHGSILAGEGVRTLAAIVENHASRPAGGKDRTGR